MTDEADVIEDTRTSVGDSELKPSANHSLSCSDLDEWIGQSLNALEDQPVSRNKVIPCEHCAQNTIEALIRHFVSHILDR